MPPFWLPDRAIVRDVREPDPRDLRLPAGALRWRVSAPARSLPAGEVVRARREVLVRRISIVAIEGHDLEAAKPKLRKDHIGKVSAGLRRDVPLAKYGNERFARPIDFARRAFPHSPFSNHLRSWGGRFQTLQAEDQLSCRCSLLFEQECRNPGEKILQLRCLRALQLTDRELSSCLVLAKNQYRLPKAI